VTVRRVMIFPLLSRIPTASPIPVGKTQIGEQAQPIVNDGRLR
jgi:hypothetical protein